MITFLYSFLKRRDIGKNCGPDDIPPPNRVNTTERILQLRIQMEKNNFDAYIIPLDEEGRREWISGFTGSNGDCIVTKDKVKFPLQWISNIIFNLLPWLNNLKIFSLKAALWTDGRYFIDASQQLDCNWILMKQGIEDVPTMEEWLKNELKPGSY